MTLSAHGFLPTYALPVLLALVVAAVWPAGSHYAPDERRTYRRLQIATLVGAIVGAKLAVLVGDLRWPLQPLPSLPTVLGSGRSITGGLIGGFLVAEAAKPVFGWRRPPNDRFAVVLPFSIAIGRVGCLLTGCCLGRPWDGPLATLDAHGIARHPAPLYELAFHLVAGLGLIALLRRGVLGGRLFALYLAAYGAFRFATEPLRETPLYAGGLTGYQLLALVMIALGGASLVARTVRPAEATCPTT